MAPTSGLGAKVTVADATPTVQDISNGISDLTLSTPVAEEDITGLGQYAHARLALLADLSLSLKGVFDGAAGANHDTLSSITSTAVARAVTIQPTSGTTPNLAANILFSKYDVTRANDGKLEYAADGNLADGTVPAWTNA